MDYIIGIIAFVFVLGVIIIIHELGHFLFARRVNVLCREFAFGMGPLLWKKKKGETLYSIRALPIGGFCAIAGEEVEDDPLKGKDEVKVEIVDGVIKKIYIDPKFAGFNDIKTYKLRGYDIFDANETNNLFMILEDENDTIKYTVDPQAMFVFAKQEYQIAPYNRTIGSKRKRDRALVMFGGPLMNFILALVVFFLAGLIGGFPNPATSQLTEVSDDTPAYAAGLRKGDTITHLQSGLLGSDIEEWNDISLFMDNYSKEYPGKVIIVKYVRDNKEHEVQIKPQYTFYSLGLVSDFSNPDKIIVLEATGKAKEAGLKKGQEILEVNDNLVTSWHDIYEVLINNVNATPVKFKVSENQNGTAKEKIITATPYSKDIMDSQQSLSGGEIPLVKVSLGVSPKNKFDLIQSFTYSGKMTLSSFTLVFKTLDMLFTSNEVGVDDLSGPVGIFDLSKNVAVEGGFIGLLNLIGLLSVNVGLLNLFPIPALDGGRLVFLGYEAITKKKPNQKVETALITITMLMLFGLMIFVFYNDILRIIGVK